MMTAEIAASAWPRGDLLWEVNHNRLGADWHMKKEKDWNNQEILGLIR